MQLLGPCRPVTSIAMPVDLGIWNRRMRRQRSAVLMTQEVGIEGRKTWPSLITYGILDSRRKVLF